MGDVSAGGEDQTQSFRSSALDGHRRWADVRRRLAAGDRRHRPAAIAPVRLLTVILSLVLSVAGCTEPTPTSQPTSRLPGDPSVTAATPTAEASASAGPGPPAAVGSVPRQFRNLLPGMPEIVGRDVYGASRSGMLAAAVVHDPALLYVPDSAGTSVTVISQRSHKILRILHAGSMSQHVTPSYNLGKLYIDSSAANELVTINPRTGRLKGKRKVPRPYNVYFTPDGRQAIVMTEQHNQIRFSDPRSFRLIASRSTRRCRGPNHADFSANGQFFLVTCEFSGTVLKLSTRSRRITGIVRLGKGSMPQDIRISPDGLTFYVALMGRNCVARIDGEHLGVVGSIRTPKGPHGLYPSRDGTKLYVSDREAGKVSVISFARQRIVATWKIPGGGSPDMGGVSADGRMLWLTGRYDGVVYGFDTATGRLVAKIKVGGSPHGMAVWPQPGRYSLGHTGNMR